MNTSNEENSNYHPEHELITQLKELSSYAKEHRFSEGWFKPVDAAIDEIARLKDLLGGDENVPYLEFHVAMLRKKNDEITRLYKEIEEMENFLDFIYTKGIIKQLAIENKDLRVQLRDYGSVARAGKELLDLEDENPPVRGKGSQRMR